MQYRPMQPYRFARMVAALAIVAGSSISTDASAQVVSARRMAMGGVVTSNGGEGSARNVAYRAIPRSGPTHLPLPAGLIQFAANPPVFDVKDPQFNAIDLADNLLNPPWHLQLVEPSAPSSDILVEVSQNSLLVDLDDLQRAFPSESMEQGGVLRFPGLYLGAGPFFGGVTSFTQVGHTLTLDPALHAALAEAEPFVGGTRYEAGDFAQAQAFAALVAGAAVPLVSPPEDTHPYDTDELVVYGGTRLKYLRGIGYLDAVNDVGFTTRDTLFGEDPVDVDLEGLARYTGGDDLFSGSGVGADFGAVLFFKRFELGLGINDLVHEVTWQVDVDTIRLDPNTNDVETIPGGENVRIDGSFPITWNAGLAYRLPGWTLAGTVVKNVGDPSFHLGAERWLGLFAVRAGTSVDSRQLMQFSAGTGVRFGTLGLDLGLATHSRSVTEERGLEMGLSIALYGGGR